METLASPLREGEGSPLLVPDAAMKTSAFMLDPLAHRVCAIDEL
jgi:hypothetical protein